MKQILALLTLALFTINISAQEATPTTQEKNKKEKCCSKKEAKAKKKSGEEKKCSMDSKTSGKKCGA
nr:hypothetical protein [uncultured Flavobacterium sp.]